MNNEINFDKVFKFNPNAFIVEGQTKSIICDIERNDYKPIPKILSTILLDKSCNTIQNVVNKYAKTNKRNSQIVISYFKALLEDDLIFYTDFPDYYVKIPLHWDSPSVITNAIIDKSSKINFAIKDFLHQLDEIGCKNVEVRFWVLPNILEIEELMELTKYSIIVAITIYLPYKNSLFNSKLKKLIKTNPRLLLIYLYKANSDKVIFNLKGTSQYIISVKQNILNEKVCGIITPNYFVSDLTTFTESQQHNSCLNRKISIDTEGNIKNCPSMPESFGNIKDTTLAEAIEKPGFKKYWNITKDQIAVCKDCEFRYICTDCRAYKEDPEDDYSKPLKCGYDPYTGVWSEWSTNPLKQKAIQYYGMEEIIKQE